MGTEQEISSARARLPRPRQRCDYRVHTPEHGLRFNPAKLLLEPCQRDRRSRRLRAVNVVPYIPDGSEGAEVFGTTAAPPRPT
jgi:hypothetical protein